MTYSVEEPQVHIEEQEYIWSLTDGVQTRTGGVLGAVPSAAV